MRASEPIFTPEEWAELCAAFPGELAEGEDPRAQGTPAAEMFGRLKGARALALDQDKIVARGQAAQEDKWPEVARDAKTFLIKYAKHFDVALWFCEANLRVRGFAGLRAGLTLIATLLDTFPGKLYPRPYPDETSADTVANLTQLMYFSMTKPGTLYHSILAQPLSQGGDGFVVTFETIIKSRDKERGVGLAKRIEQSIKQSDAKFLSELCDYLRSILDNIALLKAAMGRYTGAATVDLGRTGEQISDIYAVITGVVGEPVSDVPVPPVGGPLGTLEANDPMRPLMTGEFTTGDHSADREAAFRALLKIAEFFRRTEPHSPIAPSIEDVVRRGRLTFAELIAELVPDVEPRKKYYLNAGIRNEDPGRASGGGA